MSVLDSLKGRYPEEILVRINAAIAMGNLCNMAHESNSREDIAPNMEAVKHVIYRDMSPEQRDLIHEGIDLIMDMSFERKH